MILNLKLKRQKSNSKIKYNSKQENSDLKIAYLAATLAEEKKGEDIRLLDVSRLTIVSDYFLIVTARSTPQIEAIANNIEAKLESLNYKLLSKEGFVLSNWLILDFGNLIVHIMHEKERNYYKLERFWSNAAVIERKLWKKAS